MKSAIGKRSRQPLLNLVAAARPLGKATAAAGSSNRLLCGWSI